MAGYMDWLEPVLPMLQRWVEPEDIALLAEFGQALGDVHGLQPDDAPLATKGLLAARFGMIDAETTHGGLGRSPMVQALVQFTCGYHSLDYRDVAHVGHGRMILAHGSQRQLEAWAPHMGRGRLIAIATTEEKGGSHIQDIETSARAGAGENYLLNGKKMWISRPKEASILVVFFKFRGDETLSAALIEPTRPGVEVECLTPSGLDGWSWGGIRFHDVILTPGDLLGVRGGGLPIFKEHFAYYRPMVAITALGAAASVQDAVMAHLSSRQTQGVISTPRDTALVGLAEHYMAISAALLASLCAVAHVADGTPYASLWSRGVKAWSIDRAYAAVSELALFMGAASYRADSPIAKALRDLRGLLFADGIHDALLRSTARSLMRGM